jgi:hypothetical protein
VSKRDLPHVDPNRRRGVVYRMYARLAETRPMGWLSRRVLWKLDPLVLRVSRGRLGMGLLLPTAWFHNLVAHADVTFGGQPFRAEVVEDEQERKRLWQLADRVFPPYSDYRERAARAGRVRGA